MDKSPTKTTERKYGKSSVPLADSIEIKQKVYQGKTDNPLQPKVAPNPAANSTPAAGAQRKAIPVGGNVVANPTPQPMSSTTARPGAIYDSSTMTYIEKSRVASIEVELDSQYSMHYLTIRLFCLNSPITATLHTFYTPSRSAAMTQRDRFIRELSTP